MKFWNDRTDTPYFIRIVLCLLSLLIVVGLMSWGVFAIKVKYNIWAQRQNLCAKIALDKLKHSMGTNCPQIEKRRSKYED